MDYDKTAMPGVYDAGRGYAPEVLDMWLRTIEAAVDRHRIHDILDLGCGTGRYSGALASHFAARVIAVDPSEKMLDEARLKAQPAVHHVKGSGEDLPLSDGTVDLVFISMAFHHFEDRYGAARECRRVLRDDGMLCLRAGSTDRVDDYPFVPFFPRTRQLIRDHLASVAEMIRVFSDSGFACLRHEVVNSAFARNWAEFAAKTAYRADSILQQLSDDEFQSGLEALRAYAEAQDRSCPVVEPVDFLVFRRTAESANNRSSGLPPTRA